MIDKKKRFTAPYPAFVVLLILALSSCGGGDTDTPENTNIPGQPQTQTYKFSGTITGNSTAVTLSINDVEQSFSGPAFSFDKEIARGDLFDIKFVSTSANQICTINQSKGTALANINNLVVSCGDPVTELRFTDAGVHRSMAVGDFNGDGFADLAYDLRTYANHSTGSNNELIQFSFGDGTGAFPDTDTRMLDSTYMFSSDFTGDNLDDLIVFDGSSVPSPVVTIAGSANGEPENVYNDGLIRGSQFNAVPYDIEGDGDMDFIVPVLNGYWSWEKFAVYKNDGNGNFSDSYSFPQSGHESSLGLLNLAIADVDNDGVKDIIYIGNFDKDVHIEIITGNGDGTFNFSGTSSKITDDIFFGDFYFFAAKSVVTSDFNNDNNADIAIQSNSDFILIMLGDGNGNFSEGQKVKVSSSPNHLRVADLNKDGFVDLVSSNQDAKTLHISYGKRDGSFGDKDDIPSSWKSIQLDNNSEVIDLEIADFDQDGYLDIALFDIGIRSNETYTNGGIFIYLGVGK